MDLKKENEKKLANSKNKSDSSKDKSSEESNLPSFISNNRPNYLSSKNDATTKQENNLEKIIQEANQQKAIYQNLTQENSYLTEDKNIIQAQKEEWTKEISSLNQEFNQEQNFESKEMIKKNKIKEFQNQNLSGEKIFKTNTNLNAEQDIDNELDNELAKLEQSLKTDINPLTTRNQKSQQNTLPKKEAKNIKAYKSPKKIVKKTATKTKKSQSQKSKTSQNILILEGKIALAKAQAEKAQADAVKAKAEAEKEYYRSQTMQMQLRSRKRSWLFRNKNKKHPIN